MNLDRTDLKQALLARISQNERRKLSMKLRTLVSDFGFSASRNVRKSSLDELLKALDAWGIGYTFPDGRSANDYITLSLAATTAQLQTSHHPGAATAQAIGGGIAAGIEYRVLSVQPPWAWSIMFGGKDIENRSWSTPYRGRILTLLRQVPVAEAGVTV